MPLLRLAYSALFLIALIAVFVLWSEVGGQGHLDLMPWYLKLALGGGAAFACVKATAAAVNGKQAWNGRSLRWCGIVLVLLLCCGLASYYYHLYGESDDEDSPDDEDAPAAVVPSAASLKIDNFLPKFKLLPDFDRHRIPPCTQQLESGSSEISRTVKRLTLPFRMRLPQLRGVALNVSGYPRTQRRPTGRWLSSMAYGAFPACPIATRRGRYARFVTRA